jgi:hypothetical protein
MHNEKLHGKTHISLVDLGDYFFSGRVIYQLDSEGKIISAYYEKKGHVQQACVGKYATC